LEVFEVGPIGVPELIVIFIVALVVFGPKKLPELGKSLGHGLREFNKAKNELKATWDEQLREAETHLQSSKEVIQQPLRETIASINSAAPVLDPSHELTSGATTESAPAENHPKPPSDPPAHSIG
jgi:sec-independent protein translocase protein TatA